MDELLQEFFPGLAAMANWHPLLVHFPIALLSCFLLLDVFGALARKAEWRRVAGGMLYLGTLFAAVAVALGLQAAHTVPHGEEVHSIIISHRNHGLAVLGMALLLSVWRYWHSACWSALSNVLHLLAAAVMVTVMAHGADMGGLMVYGYGVGVQDHDHDAHDHDDGADHQHY